MNRAWRDTAAVTAPVSPPARRDLDRAIADFEMGTNTADDVLRECLRYTDGQ